MHIERHVATTILKLTRNGLTQKKLIKEDMRIPSQIIEKKLEKFRSAGLIHSQINSISADNAQRLKLAIFAIKLGADYQNISRFLKWNEFESLASVTFEESDYRVSKNFRFAYNKRRYEIDIVGTKKPLIICTDCKHWHKKLYRSALKKIVSQQIKRTFALAASLPNVSVLSNVLSWVKVELVPVILSLMHCEFRFIENVPIVPILKLQDFLNNLEGNVDSLFHLELDPSSFEI